MFNQIIISHRLPLRASYEYNCPFPPLGGLHGWCIDTFLPRIFSKRGHIGQGQLGNPFSESLLKKICPFVVTTLVKSSWDRSPLCVSQSFTSGGNCLNEHLPAHFHSQRKGKDTHMTPNQPLPCPSCSTTRCDSQAQIVWLHSANSPQQRRVEQSALLQSTCKRQQYLEPHKKWHSSSYVQNGGGTQSY